MFEKDKMFIEYTSRHKAINQFSVQLTADGTEVKTADGTEVKTEVKNYLPQVKPQPINIWSESLFDYTVGMHAL